MRGPSTSGSLTLVPTPVGNLGDITLRALEVLKAADVVAAEDTRHSRQLLNKYELKVRLERLDAHTIHERGPALLQRYANVAYITDAGTPGISDPGAELIQMALELGKGVEVLPGATALIPALVESGLPTSRFTFEGFLPRKGGSRRRRLEEIGGAATTTIIYEAPGRLAGTLRELAANCGEERQASFSREISKLHHETRRGALGELARAAAEAPVRGEVVIVVGPAPEPTTSEPDYAEVAGKLAGAGVRGRLLREALLALGAPRNEAYRLALEHPEEGASEAQ